MSVYNKLFAAIFSTLLSRWMLAYLGFDAESIGIGPELQAVVSLAIDGAVAAFNGFWVWLLPNKTPVKPREFTGGNV